MKKEERKHESKNMGAPDRVITPRKYAYKALSSTAAGGIHCPNIHKQNKKVLAQNSWLWTLTDGGRRVLGLHVLMAQECPGCQVATIQAQGALEVLQGLVVRALGVWESKQTHSACTHVSTRRR